MIDSAAPPEETEQFDDQIQIRVCCMIFLAFILFSVLGLQLWNIQVQHWQDYEDQAHRQSVRKIRLPPVRGKILTSDGIPLATNRVSWDVQFHPSEMRRPGRKKMIAHILSEAQRAADCIGRANPLTEKKIQNHLYMTPGAPLILFRDLERHELLPLRELIPSIEGMEIAQTPVRSYPYEELAVHLLGYTRQNDPNQAEDRLEFNYYVPDLKGTMGIERLCDNELRGSPGSELVMVNSLGFVCEQLEVPTPAKAGQDVTLTLDLKAQQIAEELLSGKVGSIVVVDALNGAVKAMASSPTFSAADFKSKVRYHELSENPDLPFLNRSTMGEYMPGSVIKPLTGLAVLDSGISAEETVNCKGRTNLGYNRIACNNRNGHGPMDLRNALKKSCNVYFVENGVQTGIDALAEVYDSAGFGKKSGIEIAERKGFCPINQKRWNENETAYVSFGQGKILVTPLQVAVCYAAIANGGTLWQPYLIERIHKTETRPVKRGTLAAATPENLQTIRKGMYKVVNETGGSGVRAKSEKTVIYGKTGTADVETKNLPSKHVWFAGFAEHPETKRLYSIAVLIERGESGGKAAAPLVREFFDRWF